jgi:hypothetical protein
MLPSEDCQRHINRGGRSQLKVAQVLRFFALPGNTITISPYKGRHSHGHEESGNTRKAEV